MGARGDFATEIDTLPPALDPTLLDAAYGFTVT